MNAPVQGLRRIVTPPAESWVKVDQVFPLSRDFVGNGLLASLDTSGWRTARMLDSRAGFLHFR